MRYKLYSYELADNNHKPIHPDKQYKIFERSRGRDDYGVLTEYQGQKNSVLMYLVKFGSDFTGLVGKHSTEREITNYIEEEDEAISELISDDDYPHTPFICMPRLGYIACVDGSRISANSAMSRLHNILLSRQKCWFTFKAFSAPFDLRTAVKAFRVTEVMFEILPVNPHTGALGRGLDEARKKDHVKRLKGTAEAPAGSSIKLEGGIVSAIQELQQSGHASAGFKAETSDGISIQVPKPKKRKMLTDAPDDVRPGDEVDASIVFPRGKYTYPMSQAHVTEIRKIVRTFKGSSLQDE